MQIKYEKIKKNKKNSGSLYREYITGHRELTQSQQHPIP